MQQKSEEKITIQEHLKINGVVCHTFSPCGKYIAISLKNNCCIEIYEVNSLNQLSQWKLKWKLKEQQQQISALDWSVNNSLLSTSYDRSVVVWNLKEGKWTKDLVIIECQRAILCGEWSKNGKKFVCGGGDGKCYVGYYDQENEFWQTKKIGSFKSSITNVKFHPSGKAIAVGSTDNNIEIFSSYLGGEFEDDSYQGNFQNIQDFNQTICSINDNGGWIEGITFSPSGNKLCFSVHSGVLKYALIQGDDIKGEIQSTPVKKLPMKKIVFIDENTILGGGHDMMPCVFNFNNENQLKFTKYVENSITETVVQKESKIKQLQTQMFQTHHGKHTGGQHTTPILCIQKYNQSSKLTFSSSDINGSILFWEL